jgi:hypothetical protein
MVLSASGDGSSHICVVTPLIRPVTVHLERRGGSATWTRARVIRSSVQPTKHRGYRFLYAAGYERHLEREQELHVGDRSTADHDLNRITMHRDGREDSPSS